MLYNRRPKTRRTHIAILLLISVLFPGILSAAESDSFQTLKNRRISGDTLIVSFSPPAVVEVPAADAEMSLTPVHDIYVYSLEPVEVTLLTELPRDTLSAGLNHISDAAFDGERFMPVYQPRSGPPLSVKELGQNGDRILYRIRWSAAKYHNNQGKIKNVSLRIIGSGVSLARSSVISDESFLSNDQVKIAESRQISSSARKSPVSDWGRAMKIWIREEGLYIIPRSQIIEAGWDAGLINPQNLAIYGPEGIIPIKVYGEEDGSLDGGDIIEFYGEPYWNTRKTNRRIDAYADANVYWLVEGGDYGLRIGQEEGGFPEGTLADIMYPRSYPCTLHVEQDGYFHRLPHSFDVDTEDHWFYASYLLGSEKRDFSFQIEDPDAYATQLVTVRLWCRGHAYTSENHTVDVYLNDRIVSSEDWSGRREIVLENTGVSPANLRDGSNTITLVNRSAAQSVSQLMLDRFEITYPRLYQARDNSLKFSAPRYSEGKTCRFRIDGFLSEEILIYKKHANRIVNADIIREYDEFGQLSYSLTFQDNVVNESTEYLAFTRNTRLFADTVKVVADNSIRNFDSGVDYLAVVPNDSLGGEIVQDLLDVREAQGLRTGVITLDEIYDYYNNGIPNPAALKACFTDFYNRPAKLKYVLLVGDGVVNSKLSAEEGNVMPVMTFQTVEYGAAASDHYYTLLNGDDNYPDIAIGRLPVNNRAELRFVVDKIVSYETESSGNWRNKYLLIGAGGHGDVFRTQSETIIHNVLPRELHPERLYLSGPLTDPFVGGTEDLLRHFRSGVAWINFRGHGGGAIWSDNGLLDLDDIELIDNKGKLPIVTSMTCYSNDFASSRPCLGESLVRQEETGAVAVLGATGLGWVWNDYYLLKELYTLVADHPELTLGELIRKAKTVYLQVHGGSIANTEVNQYTLLGDPALRTVFPKKTASVSASRHNVLPGDNLTIRGAQDPGSYSLLIEVVDQELTTVESETKTVSGGKWETTINMPPDFEAGNGGVRTYLWDPDDQEQHYNGYLPLQVSETYFDSLRLNPANPTQLDSMTFSVYAEARSGIARVWCLLLSPEADYINMQPDPASGCFTSASFAGPYAAGSSVRYAFVIEDSEGKIAGSDTMTYNIPYLPDLRAESPRFISGSEVTLEVSIRNSGDMEVRGFEIKFEALDFDYAVSETLTVDRYSLESVTVPFPCTGNISNVRITVDPESLVIESDESNNVLEVALNTNYFNISPDIGSFTGIGNPGPVGIPGKWICAVPSGAVAQNATLQIRTLQPGDPLLNSVAFDEMIHELILAQLSSKNGETDLTLPAEIRAFSGDGTPASAVKPYLWNPRIKRWTVLDFTYDSNDSSFTYSSEKLGIFCLAETSDREPPLIEIQVNNQTFVDGSYVSKDAVFSILVQDKSGLPMTRENVSLYLDNTLQEISSTMLPDSSSDPSKLSITFRPELTGGDHSIVFQTADIHGNWARSEEYRFIVSNSFELQYLGNHPNPFVHETVFVYVLTNSARETSIKIYTTAGKLIRSLMSSDMSMADYHEITWDGTDEWGNEVANGVYFFRLKAEGEVTRDVTGTIAKLR